MNSLRSALTAAAALESRFPKTKFRLLFESDVANGGGNQTFAATVANDPANAGVTWSIGSGTGTLNASSTTGVTTPFPTTLPLRNRCLRWSHGCLHGKPCRAGVVFPDRAPG